MNVIRLWQYGHEALLGGLENADWQRQISSQMSLKEAIVITKLLKSLEVNLFGLIGIQLTSFNFLRDFVTQCLSHGLKVAPRHVLGQVRFPYANGLFERYGNQRFPSLNRCNQ